MLFSEPNLCLSVRLFVDDNDYLLKDAHTLLICTKNSNLDVKK